VSDTISSDPFGHSHVFLAAEHERNERRTWAVIGLCGAMMAVEIVGGWLFGSIALVADGLHMSTHAGALLLAALAYSYSRRHANDERFTFGTGKLGDLAGFSSAIILAIIAVLIGYESISRMLHPIAIHFAEAIPIAFLGLAVNMSSAWLLSSGGHHHHGHSHEHDADHGVDEHVKARKRADFEEPHEGHAGAHRDNNMRAAIVHVAADAAVSILVIIGLLLAKGFGWLWMDPLAGLVGAIVIASWSYGLVRDTGAILLDMNPDRELAVRLRAMVEREGDRLTDLHLWRVGPGHLAAIVSVVTRGERPANYYREQLARYKVLSHVTLEVSQDKSAAA
jgi:cation diffusion facilitator family transporter